MIDFEKFQKDVTELEKQAAEVKKADPVAMKSFAVGLRDILAAFLKDRREPIRSGQIFKDAAAKNIVPGDIAARADALLVRWAGNVTPQDPQAIKDDAAKFASVADKTLPVLKAYRKEK
jgi:hypothetical protein